MSFHLKVTMNIYLQREKWCNIMKANVYKFLISYKGYEEKIWREVEVSGNYTLSKLAYLVLVSFDTLANHLFFIEYNGNHYEIDLCGECEKDNNIDPTTISLNKMGLEIGSVMKMVYDYGCEQEFVIILKEISDMEKGTSLKYPRIVAGQGKGILDNMFSDDFGEVIKQIDEKNKSEQMYLSPTGEYELWDYRDFNIDEMNRTVKSDIEAIQNGFEG